MKNFCYLKNSIKKIRREAKTGKNICNTLSDKVLLCQGYIKNSQNLLIRRKTTE